MTSLISSDSIIVAVESTGAELKNLQTGDGHEYLWLGDPSSWASRSPVLFPIIGSLPNETYTVDGQKYRLQGHGFARRREFDLLEETETTLLYSITSDEQSLTMYPYRFELRLRYTVKGPRLAVNYEVTNTDRIPMLFSIGGHPGFNCPLEPGLSFEDYRLVFDHRETVDRHIKTDGLLTGETEPLLRNQDTLPLDHELFDRGAVIIRNHRSTRLTLESSQGSRRVTVDFAGFPDLGIWSHANRVPLVCIEPWFGVDSSRGDSSELSAKYGMVQLDPEQTFAAAFGITLE